MSNFHEEDNIMDPKKKFDDIIQEINIELDKAHCARRKGHCHIDDREFKQFKKGWFYHHWAHRFRRLGNMGVIAIPNTSLEEWIYWLYEWSQAFVDDYNKFKDLVFEAIKLHEEHLTILDTKVEDLENRVEEIERQLVLIWEEIRKLIQEVNNIKNEITNIKNDITNINNRVDGLQNEMNNFKGNIFSTNYPNSVRGRTTNGWKPHPNPSPNEIPTISFDWGWNNEQDHNQGAHWVLVLNYIVRDNCTYADMANFNEIGVIPFPQELKDAGYSFGESWLYSGYVAQSYNMVGVVFLQLRNESDGIHIRITNTTRSVEPSGNIGTVQLNTGGAPTQYLSK